VGKCSALKKWGFGGAPLKPHPHCTIRRKTSPLCQQSVKLMSLTRSQYASTPKPSTL